MLRRAAWINRLGAALLLAALAGAALGTFNLHTLEMESPAASSVASTHQGVLSATAP